MQEHTKRLGTAPLGRLLIALSLPGIAATISTSLYNIVDTIWVGKIGHEAIAALTIIFPYQILYWAVGGGTGVGISALVSRRFGEKKPDEANHIAGQIFFLSAFWGLFFMLVSLFFSDHILPIMGATEDIYDFSKTYLIVTSLGAPFALFSAVSSSLIRGSGDTVKPMIIMVLGTVVNIILDPLMILGIGPFPEMGVAGAAWATFIAQGCSTALGLYYLATHKTAYRFKAFDARPDWKIIKDIYRVGAPSAIMQVAETVIFILLNNLVAAFGSVAIAALGLILRVSDLAFLPTQGVAHGLLPVVGYCFGAGNYKRLWQAFKLASFGLFGFLLLTTIMLEIFTPQLISIFIQDQTVIDAAVPALRISFISLPILGPTLLATTVFQGLSRGGTALFLSLIKQFVVFIPLLYLCRYLWGLTGIWISWPIADTLNLAVAFIFIFREYAIHKRKSLLISDTVVVKAMN
jgi:putative MATE family efflux protein